MYIQEDLVANHEPTYIIKWIAGIVGSVITTYLIANFITNNNSNLGPDIDAGRGLLPIEQQNGLFKFEYPVFLDKVTQSDSSDQPFVAISAISSDLIQAKAMEKLTLFKELTTISPSIDLDKMGMVAILLVPTYYLLDVTTSKKTDSQSPPAEADVFAGFDTIATAQVDWANLPSSGCTQKRSDNSVNLSYLYASHGVSLLVDGRFTKEAWSTHRSEIRRMLGSFTVKEVASVQWFKTRLEDGSIKYEESVKLSAYLSAIADSQLSANLQQDKAPDCIETL
jgi:hypothetical protein